MSVVIDSPLTDKAMAADPPSSSKLRLGVVVGLLAIGYAPLLWQHFLTMWERPEYQYFPFVLGAFGYLLWQRVQTSDIRFVEPSDLNFGMLKSMLLFGAWVALLGGVYLFDPWLAVASTVVSVGLLLSVVFATRRISNLWGIWCLLWLVVPLPLGFDKKLVVKLQSASSWLSSQAMDLLQIDHLMAGNVLRMSDKQFFVDEACSGIVSIMSVIACGAIYCVWRNRPLFHSILLLLAGVLAAVTLNAARITTIAAAHAYLDIDLSEGTPHETLGLVLFLFTFLALIGSDYFLWWFLRPVPMAMMARPGDYESRNPVGTAWNWWTAFGSPYVSDSLGGDGDDDGDRKRIHFQIPKLLAPACVAFAALGVVHVVAWGTTDAEDGNAIEITTQMHESSMPAQIGSWKMVAESFSDVTREENSGYGEYSKSVRYIHEDLGIVAQASIDYPFNGSWHELSYCYELSGWAKERRQVLNSADTDSWAYIEADYNQDGYRFGNLFYSVMDDSTSPVSPPAAGLQERIWRRMRRRGPRHAWPIMLQVQVWHESSKTADETTRQALVELFLRFRESHQEFVLNHVQKRLPPSPR